MLFVFIYADSLQKIIQAPGQFELGYNRVGSMLIRNIVTEENQIKLFLKTLFNNYPRACKKESISGFTSYDRVLIVRGEVLEYYNMPSKFKEGDASTLSDKNFKSRVNLTDIYELAFLPENVGEKKSMMLSIPLNKITASNIGLYKEQAAKNFKQKQNQQNSIVNWLFIFDYDVKAEVFNKLNEEQKKKKEAQSKVIRYDPQSDLADSILNVTKDKIPEPEINPVQDLHQNIDKLKRIKEEIQFQEKMEKQQEQRQKIIKQSMSLRKNDKGGGDSSQNDDEQEIFPLSGAWLQFWRTYEKATKSLGQPVTKEYLQKELAVLSQMHKIENEVKTIATHYINFKMVGWSAEKNMFDDFEFYKGLWIKLGGKELNQEFLSNYYLSDVMYVIKTHKKMKFRIPPMFFINYKSVKALCMIDQPFSKIKALQKQIYNIKIGKSKIDIELMAKIKVCFEFFEKILNVKTENYISGNYQTSAPLGHDVKVFEYDNKYEENASSYLENFYYVTGVKGLFPVDYEFQKEKYRPEYCLRPQIIAEYRDYMESVYRDDNQLLSQAFLYSDINLETKAKEDIKVAQVSQEFIPLKIKKLMHEFNQINLIMVDSYSIKSYMSDMGINSRYLGHMYKETEIPYIQETLQIEMLSKTVKTIYNQSVNDLITNQAFFKRELYLKKHHDVLEDNMKNHHELMVQNAIDFLNLVFGVGKQTETFWKIVIDKCKKRFGHSFPFPLKVKPGCLLHAILWHCGFVITFDLDVKLFEVEKPFDLKNWNDFRLESKSFQYPSFEINKIVKKLSFFNDIKEGDQEIKKFMSSFLKIELLRNNNSFGLGLQTQITMSRLNNLNSQIEKPVRECSLHPSELPYYFTNRSQQNFKRALDIINFSLASNHPLFIGLYDEYSQQFEPELLKKSTLLAAIKGLGEFHPRTTQLYSKYYRQGFQQFEIKAKRSLETEAALTITEQLFSKKKYESCLNFCFSRIERRQKQKSSTSGNDLTMYVQILKYGLISATYTRFYKKGLIIAEQLSEMINTYKIRNPEDHQILLYYALIIKLNLTTQKFYLYKMVLLAVKIQKQFEPNLAMDEEKFLLPRSPAEKSKILHGIINEYYLHETHSKWIENIFVSLKRGYIYFNYLDDLFNNYHYHIKNYGMKEFENALGYLDVLVRYFGQKIFYDCLYTVNN